MKDNIPHHPNRLKAAKEDGALKNNKKTKERGIAFELSVFGARMVEGGDRMIRSSQDGEQREVKHSGGSFEYSERELNFKKKTFHLHQDKDKMKYVTMLFNYDSAESVKYYHSIHLGRPQEIFQKESNWESKQKRQASMKDLMVLVSGRQKKLKNSYLITLSAYFVV